MPNKPRPDDPEQYKRFIEAAKQAQADETHEGADRAFGKVARKPVNRRQGIGSAGSRAKPSR